MRITPPHVANEMFEGLFGEEIVDNLNQWQRASLTRWSRAYGYQTIEGYLTAKFGVEWKDYSYLREHSP